MTASRTTWLLVTLGVAAVGLGCGKSSKTDTPAPTEAPAQAEAPAETPTPTEPPTQPAAPAVDPEALPTVAWSSFAPGASVTYRVVTERGEASTEMIQTRTCKSVAADGVLVEVTTEVRTEGQTLTLPVEDLDVSSAPPELDASAQAGTETLEVEAGTVECQWAETTSAVDGVTIIVKQWVNSAVPGGLVKKTLRKESAGETTTITTELIDYSPARPT